MDDLTSPSERHPVSPEKLSELTQLLTSCWEDVVTHRLVHPENEVSLRRTIASRIISAWEHGIDHVAIAAGAGRPTIIDITNNLIRGIRKASDFLMALQLTGADR